MACARWINRTATAFLGASLLSCGSDSTGPETETVAAVQLSPAAATLASIGSSQQFHATARDREGNSLPDVVFSWSSSNAAVAEVNENGLATAVGLGVAHVRATAGGVSDSSTLTVDQTVTSVEVSPGSAILPAIGATQQFQATAHDANGYEVALASFAWNSTSQSVVTVDATGLATAQSLGTAWVVAATQGVRDSALVTVSPAGPISIIPVDWRMPIGERVRFTAIIDGPGTTTLNWSVNGIAGGNAEVGTIDSDGNYTAPGAIPSSNPVIVRGAQASDPATYAESPVTITPGGEQARIIFHLWTPRVVDPGSTDSLTYEINFAGYPRFEFERPGGARLAATPLRAGIYGFRFSTADVLTGYDSGDLHNFVGYLNCDICARVRRGNVFVNVNDATVPSVSVTQLADDIQVASHVVNIRYDDLFLAAAIPTAVLQRFYAFFPDGFDFVAVIEQVNSFNNRSYRAVRNDVAGLGLLTFDDGAAYGSAARLQGLVDYPISGLFDAAEKAAVHEIGHRWMAFLDNPMLATAVPHWPISTIARGIMGFSGYGGQGLNFGYEVRKVSGNVYELVCNVGYADQYNDLELYLMGLLPADSVASHAVFQDQSMTLGCGVQGTVDTISIQEIIAVNGTRNPDYQSAQKDFRLAAIVLSRERLLTAEEMGFFNQMAARGEATTELHYTSGFAEGTTKPFYLATDGRATLTTRVWP